MHEAELKKRTSVEERQESGHQQKSAWGRRVFTSTGKKEFLRYTEIKWKGRGLEGVNGKRGETGGKKVDADVGVRLGSVGGGKAELLPTLHSGWD